MHVHGIKTKKQKINPNLTCGRQKNNKKIKQRLISMKKGQNKGITCDISKENKAES